MISRRLLVAVALGCVSASPVGIASATHPPTVSVVHHAPIPCAVMCANWEIPTTAGADVCSDPFPPGSHDESIYRFTDTPGWITVTTSPVMDYDTYVCTDTQPRRLVATLANNLAELCAGGPIPGVGVTGWSCPESGVVTLAALHAVNGGENDRFVLISYNWSDLYPLPVELWGPVELVDDSYDPTAI